MLNKCPICHSIHHKKLNFGGYKYQEKFYDLVKCSKCGFMFLNPKPNQNLLKKLYNDSNYFTGDYSGGERINYKDSFNHNKKRYQEIINRIKKYKKNGTLLEIGCAGGHFLKLAKDFGYKVKGLEISEIMAEFARKKIDLDVSRNYR